MAHRKLYLIVVRLRENHKRSLYDCEELLNDPRMTMGANMVVVRLQQKCI